MLPILYLGIIGAAVRLIVWYAGSGAGAVAMESGSVRVFILIYLAPLFAGAMLVIALIKPLFASRAKPKAPVLVTREEQPALWSLVEKLCAIVHAPVPRTIALDCSANASAAFEPGLIAFMSGRLRLTIGMTLVTGMSLQQLTGVLAHEFGHFAQGGGMRVSAVIRHINNWFTQAVYQRDAFDRFLIGMGRTGTIFTVAPAAFAFAGIWLVRKLLWVFMMLGHVISANLMREMEFDADTLEVRIAGSDCFVSALRRVVELAAANTHAWQLANESYKNGKLPEDIPMLAANSALRLTARARTAVETSLAHEKGSAFDSHPTPSARCDFARGLADEGIFHAPYPATCLFENGAALSRKVTRHHYTVINDLAPDKLSPAHNEEIEKHDRLRTLNASTLDEAFGGLFILEIPIVFPELLPLPDAPACAAHVRAASENMRAALTTLGNELVDLKKADEAHIAQEVASMLMAMDCKMAARQIPGAKKLRSSETAMLEASDRSDTCKALITKLSGYEKPVSEFLHATVRQRLVQAPDDRTRDDIHLRWEILKSVRKQVRLWARLRVNAASLGAGLNAIATSNNPEEAIPFLHGSAGTEQLAQALEDFRKFRCPFADAPEGSTMRDFLTLNFSSTGPDLECRYRCMQYFVSRLEEAHTRIGGWLMREDAQNTHLLQKTLAQTITWPEEPEIEKHHRELIALGK